LTGVLAVALFLVLLAMVAAVLVAQGFVVVLSRALPA
jgi:hypothetical protein